MYYQTPVSYGGAGNLIAHFEIIPAAAGIMVRMSFKEETKKFDFESINATVLSILQRSSRIPIVEFFTVSQKKALMKASDAAGVKSGAVNSPVAVLIALGLVDVPIKKNLKSPVGLGNYSARRGAAGPQDDFLLFDLGEQSLNVMVMGFQSGKLRVKSGGGDTSVGGADFADVILNFAASEFQAKHGVQINSGTALSRLRAACKRAVLCLCSESQSTIQVDNLFRGHDLQITISRDKLQRLGTSLFQKCLNTVNKCLRQARIEIVDHIILLGEYGKMSMLHRILADLFDCRAKLHLAYAEGVQQRVQMLLGDKNFPFPNLECMDATALSLGIEISNGFRKTVIPKNTPFPVRKEVIFSTVSDYQTKVNIKVLQGARPLAQDNDLLGEFVLEGIRPRPRGMTRIRVCFEMEMNGILVVSVEETGRIRLSRRFNNALTVENIFSLSDQLLRFNTILADAYSYWSKDLKAVGDHGMRSLE